MCFAAPVLYYDCGVWRSTRRHGSTGCPDDDIQHAATHAIVAYELGDDDSPRRTLLLGPDRAANMLEVIVLVFDDGREMVIHAMRMRPIYDDLLRGFRGDSR